MEFSESLDLAMEIDKYMQENKIAKNTYEVISVLNMWGMLKETKKIGFDNLKRENDIDYTGGVCTHKQIYQS